MRVGDMVTVSPVTLGELDELGRQRSRTLSGRVVYVHPRGRYYTAAFRFFGRELRESFFMDGREICDSLAEKYDARRGARLPEGRRRG